VANRLLRQESSPERNAAVVLWLANGAMIGGWTELFFRQHMLRSSMAAAGAMTAGTAALAATAWKVDRHAAVFVAPLAGWLAFATLLSEEIWRRNDESPAA
jgi:benzodiazapine receptor